jgi:MFS family permease
VESVGAGGDEHEDDGQSGQRRRLAGRLALDLTPARRSRPFRWLAIGQVVTSLGAQAAMVALPYQIYVLSHSATLVGLLGAFELGPMIVVSLVGGALADRRDRRPILVVAQTVVMAVTAILFALSLVGTPPVLAILVLGGLLAGAIALAGAIRSAVVPTLLGPELLRSGLTLNYGLNEAAGIVGPGLGGLLIGIVGVQWIYAIDAFSGIGMIAAAIAIGPQPPIGAGQRLPVLRAIGEGLRFVVRSRAIAGSFAIDINAMTFGMPRALFAVLSLSVYHAGAGGTGLLYTALAVGGTLAVLVSGWVQEVSRLGRVVIGCVLLWGLSILCAGLVSSIWLAAALLALAGWADGISAVCRTQITQTLTPDRLRGRTSAVYSLVVTSGPRLGDIESGLVAGIVGALDSVIIGGAACVVCVGAIVALFPDLAAYDADCAMELVRAENYRQEGMKT